MGKIPDKVMSWCKTINICRKEHRWVLAVHKGILSNDQFKSVKIILPFASPWLCEYGIL